MPMNLPIMNTVGTETTINRSQMPINSTRGDFRFLSLSWLHISITIAPQAKRGNIISAIQSVRSGSHPLTGSGGKCKRNEKQISFVRKYKMPVTVVNGNKSGNWNRSLNRDDVGCKKCPEVVVFD